MVHINSFFASHDLSSYFSIKVAYLADIMNPDQTAPLEQSDQGS